jgi:hypothetical protein
MQLFYTISPLPVWSGLCIFLFGPCEWSLANSRTVVRRIQKLPRNTFYGLFVWFISHQPAVLFSQNKSATSNQPAVLFSQNKQEPAISHQPNEQPVRLDSIVLLSFQYSSIYPNKYIIMKSFIFTARVNPNYKKNNNTPPWFRNDRN